MHSCPCWKRKSIRLYWVVRTILSVIPLIEQIVGESVRVIDPAPAVARQIERLLQAQGIRNSAGTIGNIKFYTSGDPSAS